MLLSRPCVISASQAMYEEHAAAVEAATADLERQRLANEALRERGAALEK